MQVGNIVSVAASVFLAVLMLCYILVCFCTSDFCMFILYTSYIILTIFQNAVMEFVTSSSTDANLSAIATQNQLNEVRILCYNVLNVLYLRT